MANGDFLAVLDTQLFAVVASYQITISKRTKNIVVLVSMNLAAGTPLARSISINDAGEIDGTPVDSLTLWANNALDIGLIHWNDDVFIAIHNDDSAGCRLISFTVSSTGTIPDSIEDDLTLVNASNMLCVSDLLKPHGNVLITGESGAYGPKHVETAIVTAGGAFGTGPADSMELAAVPHQQRHRQGAGDRIVVAFTSGYNIYIASYTCTSGAAVPATPDDAWQPFTSGTFYIGFSKVTDLVYAIFTIDDDDVARIRTFSIKVDGTINKSFIDTEAVDTVDLNAAYMTEMGEGIFIVAYQVPTDQGRLKSYYIDNDGWITDGPIDTLDIVSSSFRFPTLIHLQGNIWALAFINVDDGIYIHTLQIQTPGAARPHNEMTLGIGP